MSLPALHVFKNADELLPALADFFVRTARQAIADKSEFTVALAGGSSPKRLYQLLASPPYSGRLDWEKIYFFLGDERYVPLDDPDSNAKMIRETLFDPLRIPAENIFVVDTSLPPPDAARAYAEAIQARFQAVQVRFDLVLLGLGDNSHTASLFPNTPVLNEPTPTVKEVFLPDQNVYRITLTAPLINLARQIAFLVYGEAKAEAVRHVLHGAPDPDQYPAQLIRPADGEVAWFLDEAAAQLLVE